MNWTPETIRLLRWHIGETQAQFAARCGAKRISTVCAWERGVYGTDGIACRLLDFIARDVEFTEAKCRAMMEAKNRGERVRRGSAQATPEHTPTYGGRKSGVLNK